MRDDIGLVASLLVSDPDRTRCLPSEFGLSWYIISYSPFSYFDLEPDGLWFRYGILISPSLLHLSYQLLHVEYLYLLIARFLRFRPISLCDQFDET